MSDPLPLPADLKLDNSTFHIFPERSRAPRSLSLLHIHEGEGAMPDTATVCNPRYELM